MEIIYLSYHCVLAEMSTFITPCRCGSKAVVTPGNIPAVSTGLPHRRSPCCPALHFTHLSKPAAGTTIAIHADGKSSHGPPAFLALPPSQGPSSLPVSQSTLFNNPRDQPQLLYPGAPNSSWRRIMLNVGPRLKLKMNDI